MDYRVERDNQVVAEGETALVCFDYNLRKPRRLDAEFRARLEAFEGN
jgi:acyl-CoA thioesterase FadM